MSTRSIHRAKIKELVDTIVLNGRNIVVNKYYTSNADAYPFFYIYGGKFRPNIQGSETLMTNTSYYSERVYFLVGSFLMNFKNVEAQEAMMDEAEELIERKFNNKEGRNDETWDDCFCSDVDRELTRGATGNENICNLIFTILIKDINPFN